MKTVRTWLLLILSVLIMCTPSTQRWMVDHGAVIRGDRTKKKLALIFTGGDFADGGPHIHRVLDQKNIKAGFFFTGDFYRDPAKGDLIRSLIRAGHYLGPHSDKHLLYAPWHNRDSSLVTEAVFKADLLANYQAMEPFGLKKDSASFFIPPYEWYNRQHVLWARQLGITLFNFTPGASSNADYTTPDMQNYRSSQAIYDAILTYEQNDAYGLNGFILLLHIGTDPARTDKFYFRLADLIDALRQRGYHFQRIDALLQQSIKQSS